MACKFAHVTLCIIWSMDNKICECVVDQPKIVFKMGFLSVGMSYNLITQGVMRSSDIKINKNNVLTWDN